MSGVYIITNRRTQAAVAAIGAPEETKPHEIVRKFVLGQGLTEDAAVGFRADWFPVITWDGHLADVDKPINISKIPAHKLRVGDVVLYDGKWEEVVAVEKRNHVSVGFRLPDEIGGGVGWSAFTLFALVEVKREEKADGKQKQKPQG